MLRPYRPSLLGHSNSDGLICDIQRKKTFRFSWRRWFSDRRISLGNSKIETTGFCTPYKNKNRLNSLGLTVTLWSKNIHKGFVKCDMYLAYLTQDVS
jgi:hypothetical protein